jgi:putative polyketide hydroxylase
MPEIESRHVQVLIVGAGPAGLVSGITLARYGVRVLLVEKRDEIAGLSRALVISTRGMEILRSWGLEERVRAGAADVEPRGWVTPTLASREGREIPLGYPTSADAAAVSPTRPAWAPQDHLEPLLLGYLREFATVEVCFGCELVELEQGRDGVHAQVRDRHSGQSWKIESLFTIGADGAHSTVREQVGIRMDGRDSLGNYERVEFRAPLAQIAGDRRYGLTIITHPDAKGVLAPRGPNDRWGFSCESTPGQTQLVDASQEQLVQIITTAVGVPDLNLQIERTSSFTFAAQIAEHYRDGAVFLVGDAVHRMTPRGGTGMNTAIQDAYDLGWKMGWVLRGWARAGLLDSYQTERRPVGGHNVSRSADPDGARRDAVDALPWDLNGRVAHYWVRRGSAMLSTLDLLGAGLTVLAGPEEPGWTEVADNLGTHAPVTAHVVDAQVADTIGIPRGGARLLRPDGRQVLQWTSLDGLHHGHPLPPELTWQEFV